MKLPCKLAIRYQSSKTIALAVINQEADATVLVDDTSVHYVQRYKNLKAGRLAICLASEVRQARDDWDAQTKIDRQGWFSSGRSFAAGGFLIVNR